MKTYKLKIKGQSHLKAVQDRLFELGYVWGSSEGGDDAYHLQWSHDDEWDAGVIYLEANGTLEYDTVEDKAEFNKHKTHKAITLDGLFNLDDIVVHAEVELNEDYTARVYRDEVVVGCQTFPAKKLKELVSAHKELMKSLK